MRVPIEPHDNVASFDAPVNRRDKDGPTWGDAAAAELADDGPGPAGAAIARRTLEQLFDAARLSRRDVAVLVLRHGLAVEWTVEEIAAAFGVSHQAVSAAERRAMIRLRTAAVAGERQSVFSR
ncbi:MAG: hypothetical protein MUF27_03635 [Acidobacteria bacterium]|nr:hypothetical protein [Acidobacteriota bacterium]